VIGLPSDVPQSSFEIVTLGCKVNQVESEEIAATLMGCGMPRDREAPSLVVVNTCCVTADAEKKSRKAVRRAVRAGSDVVITGCLAVIDPEGVRGLAPDVRTVCEKAKVVDVVLETLGRSIEDCCPVDRTGPGFHTRVMVKVQSGCDARCAYCIVPDARGKPVSMDVASVVDEVRRLVETGVREVVLTGTNIGRHRSGVATLVKEVAGTGIERLRLSSIEPMDLTDEVLDVLTSVGCIAPHLHVPLQSGSAAVLGNMGRGYGPDDFAERVSAAQAAIPGLAVATDILVGFPGETERDVDDTEHLVRALGLTRLHVFRYSPRVGTPAADMPLQVDESTKRLRAKRLRDVDAELRAAHMVSMVGSKVVVLVERVIHPGVGRGTSGEYLQVEVERPGIAVGDLVDVVLGVGDTKGVLRG